MIELIIAYAGETMAFVKKEEKYFRTTEKRNKSDT